MGGERENSLVRRKRVFIPGEGWKDVTEKKELDEYVHYGDAQAEIDRLTAERDQAIKALSKAEEARGRAEGRLAASELVGVVDGWKARAEKAEAEVERLRDLVNRSAGIFTNCTVTDGTCCCGDSMENHPRPMHCGHSPVDHGGYVVDQWMEDYDALQRKERNE